MSRSRHLRSRSIDGLNRTLDYSSSLADDNSCRPSSFGYSDPHDYEQEFQSRHNRDFSQSSGFIEMDTNYYQRHPMKERRVTWDLPELSTARNRLLCPNERSMRTYGTSTYRNSNQSCPTHGYRGHEILEEYNFDASSYNSRPTPSSLYEIRPSIRRLSSRYNSSLYGDLEPKISRGYTQSSSGSHMTLHRCPSCSSLKSPLLHMGYYSPIGADYRGTGNSLLSAQSNLRRPKWRRSIIGLNRWSMI